MKLTVKLIIFRDVTAFSLKQRYLLGYHSRVYIIIFPYLHFFPTVTLMSVMAEGCSENNYSTKVSAQAMWPWSGNYPNFYVVPWVLAFRRLRLRKHSGFCFNRIKMRDSFSAVLRSVKQRTVVELLSHWNESSLAVHGQFSAFGGEITVEVKYWASLDDKISAKWRKFETEKPTIVSKARHRNSQFWLENLDKIFPDNWRISQIAVAEKIKHWVR